MVAIDITATPNSAVPLLSGDPLTRDEWTRVRALFPYDVIARIASVPDRIEVMSWRTAVLSPEVAYQRLRAALEVARRVPADADPLAWLLASNLLLSGLAPLQILSSGDPNESLERLLHALAGSGRGAPHPRGQTGAL